MPHLVADISHHGYGHLAQTLPVLRAVAARVPGLRLTIRCALPEAVIAARLGLPFAHRPRAMDVAWMMDSAVDIRVEDSFEAYARFHADWPQRVAREAAEFEALRPDLLLANAGYLPLAAARAAGIPAVGMSSLNWADLFRHYCGERPGATRMHREMLEGYRSARAFLRLAPGMPMEGLGNAVPVGPVGRTGRNLGQQIRGRLGLAAGCRLALVALGGIPTRLPFEHWPVLDGLHWLVPREWHVERCDATAFEALDLPFIDVLASSDAVLAKPGYGTYVEAALNGVAVLTMDRPDWPETPFLVEWLRENTRCAVVTRAELEQGRIAAQIDATLAQPRRPAPRPDGIEQAAGVIARALGGDPVTSSPA